MLQVDKNPHPQGWGYTDKARLRGLKKKPTFTNRIWYNTGFVLVTGFVCCTGCNSALILLRGVDVVSFDTLSCFTLALLQLLW